MWFLSPDGTLTRKKKRVTGKATHKKELIATELPSRDGCPIFLHMLNDSLDFRLDHISQSVIRCWIFSPACLQQAQNKSISFYESVIWRHLSVQQRVIQQDLQTGSRVGALKKNRGPRLRPCLVSLLGRQDLYVWKVNQRGNCACGAFCISICVASYF